MTDNDAALKQNLRVEAARDLEAWYIERNAAIERQKQQNRLGDSEPADNRSVAASESGSYAQSI